MTLIRVLSSIGLQNIAFGIVAYVLVLEPIIAPPMRIGILMLVFFCQIWSQFLVRMHIKIEAWELDDTARSLVKLIRLLIVGMFFVSLVIIEHYTDQHITKNIMVLALGLCWGITVTDQWRQYKNLIESNR